MTNAELMYAALLALTGQNVTGAGGGGRINDIVYYTSNGLLTLVNTQDGDIHEDNEILLPAGARYAGFVAPNTNFYLVASYSGPFTLDTYKNGSMERSYTATRKLFQGSDIYVVRVRWYNPVPTPAIQTNDIIANTDGSVENEALYAIGAQICSA